MKMELAPGLSVRESEIHGRGCFAARAFGRRKKIAEYTGERITAAEARRRAARRAVLRICAINERWSLDGSRGGNGTHYMNHSCRPNCFMRIRLGRIEFFALRDIRPGEEITLDYTETLHSDSKRCSCRSRQCRGTINRK